MMYKKNLVQKLIQNQSLKFGEFTLRSGKKSNFFINFGSFLDGEILEIFGNLGAEIIQKNFQPENYDIIFGTAYKGIMLAISISIALKMQYNITKQTIFNRKEIKKHGESGDYIGGDMQNKKVIIVDDVFTTGSAIHESIEMLNKSNAELAGIIVFLDRMEKINEKHTAMQVFKAEFPAIKIISILTIDDLQLTQA